MTTLAQYYYSLITVYENERTPKSVMKHLANELMQVNKHVVDRETIENDDLVVFDDRSAVLFREHGHVQFYAELEG